MRESVRACYQAATRATTKEQKDNVSVVMKQRKLRSSLQAQIWQAASEGVPPPENPFHNGDWYEKVSLGMAHLRYLGHAKSVVKDIVDRSALFGQKERLVTAIDVILDKVKRRVKLPNSLDIADFSKRALWIAANHAAFIKLLPWVMDSLPFRLGKQAFHPPRSHPAHWSSDSCTQFLRTYDGFDHMTRGPDGRRKKKSIKTMRAEINAAWRRDGTGPAVLLHPKCGEHDESHFTRLANATHAMVAALGARDAKTGTVNHLRWVTQRFLDEVASFESLGPKLKGSALPSFIRRPNCVNSLNAADQLSELGSFTDPIMHDLGYEAALGPIKAECARGILGQSSNKTRWKCAITNRVLKIVQRLYGVTEESQDTMPTPNSPTASCVLGDEECDDNDDECDSDDDVANTADPENTEIDAEHELAEIVRQNNGKYQAYSELDARTFVDNGECVSVIGIEDGASDVTWGIAVMGHGEREILCGQEAVVPRGAVLKRKTAHWVRLIRQSDEGVQGPRSGPDGFTVYFSYQLAEKAVPIDREPTVTGILLPANWNPTFQALPTGHFMILDTIDSRYDTGPGGLQEPWRNVHPEWEH